MEQNNFLRNGMIVICALTAVAFWKVDKADYNPTLAVARTREKSGFEYKMVRPTYKPPVRDLEIEDSESAGEAGKKIAELKKTPGKDPKKDSKKNAKNDKKKKDTKTAKKADATAHNKLAVSVTPSGERGNSGTRGRYAENDFQNSNYGYPQQQTTKKLSGSQWRVALLGNPNLANITKFVDEYNSGMVDENDFYSICEELLADSRSDAQLYTVQILGTLEHPKAFDLLVRFQGKLNTPAENLLTAVFDFYKQLQKAPLISAVLKSDFEKPTIAKATELAYILSHKAAAKGGRQAISAQSTQTGRTPVAVLGPVESHWLTSLVRPLRALLESSDPEISQSAEVALSQLQLTGIE